MTNKIICALSGSGKRTLSNNDNRYFYLDEYNYKVSVSASGKLIYSALYPYNYMQDVFKLIKKDQILLLSAEHLILNYLNELSLDFVLIYPNNELKLDYIERLSKVRDTQYVVNFYNNWSKTLKSIEFYKKLATSSIELNKGQYLQNIVEGIV